MGTVFLLVATYHYFQMLLRWAKFNFSPSLNGVKCCLLIRLPNILIFEYPRRNTFNSKDWENIIDYFEDYFLMLRAADNIYYKQQRKTDTRISSIDWPSTTRCVIITDAQGSTMSVFSCCCLLRCLLVKCNQLKAPSARATTRLPWMKLPDR